MVKPLGYYTSYTPGDDSYLGALQQVYGASFQKMTRREKCVILNLLSAHLSCYEQGDCRDEIFSVGQTLTQELTPSDQAGMIEALINQLRWGQNAEPVHHS